MSNLDHDRPIKCPCGNVKKKLDSTKNERKMTSVLFLAPISFTVIGLMLCFAILYTKKKVKGTSLFAVHINSNSKTIENISAGTTLLEALSIEGISIPSPCGGKATCKQCKLKVVDKSIPPSPIDEATFTPKQVAEGWRLSCQSKIKKNLNVAIPEAYLSVKSFKGRVVSNHNVATFIKELIIETDYQFDYQPGDYLQFSPSPFKTNTSMWKETIDPVYHDDWVKFGLFDKELDFSHIDRVIRAYSLASYPQENHIKFNVRIATPPILNGKVVNNPWGICSSYIFSLKEGDEVDLSGPFGESHMHHDDRELVFLIGGAGSSFGRSHILDLFYEKNTKRKVTLWYGARSLRENIYQEDYESLQKQFPNFSYHLVLSSPLDEDFRAGWPKDDPVKTNFLFQAFKVGQLDSMQEPEEALYYVCGPPMHNHSVLKLLDDYGVEKTHIVLDDFGS